MFIHEVVVRVESFCIFPSNLCRLQQGSQRQLWFRQQFGIKDRAISLGGLSSLALINCEHSWVNMLVRPY
jgi:hypothetical protein